MDERLTLHVRGSDQMGHGHVVRGIALAQAARGRGLDTVFAPADLVTAEILSGYGEATMRRSDPTPTRYIIRDLPEGSDDDSVREERERGARVLLMDDSGPARTVAPLVADAMMTGDRAGSLPHSDITQYLYGFPYAALRPEIQRHRGLARPGTRDRSRLLIALGGGFDDAVPFRLLDALAAVRCADSYELLLPREPSDPNLISQARARHEASVQVRTQTVGAHLARADLVLTKIGVTVLEAFAVGVGCILVEPSAAHLEVGAALSAAYPGWPALESGPFEHALVPAMAKAARDLLQDHERLQVWGHTARGLVDGQGAARLLDALLDG